MPDINAGKFTRFRDGGVITITDVETSTVHTLVGRERNSLQFTPGMFEGIVDMEEGALKADVRRGDERPTRLRIAAKATSSMRTAAGLLGILLDQTKATDDGLLRKFTVTCTFRPFSGAGTTEVLTFSNCIVNTAGADPLSYAEGDEYDLLTVEFLGMQAVPVIS